MDFLNTYRGRLTLRAFGLMLFVPVLLMVAAGGLMFAKISLSLDRQAANLSAATVEKLLSEQRAAVNIGNLRYSIHTLAVTENPNTAREAYIDAWAVLSESLLDRRPGIRDRVNDLQQRIIANRPIRIRLDETVSRLYDDWHALFSKLHMIANHTGYVFSDAELEHFGRFDLFNAAGSEMHERIEDIKRHWGQACRLAVDSHTKDLCYDAVQSIHSLTLNNAEFSRISADFREDVKGMQQSLAELTGSYIQIENSQLLTEVEGLTDLAHQYRPLVVLPVVTVLIMLIFIICAVRTIIVPIRKTVHDVNRFEAEGVMPPPARPSLITEINALIAWLTDFCLLSRAEKEKAMLIERKYSKLEARASTDSLTGVANRRAFEDMKARFPELTAGTGMLMIDIDDFKAINDSMGHPFGDRILAALGPVLRRSVSPRDTVYRYGGEEFCVVLANCGYESLFTVGEHIVEAVRSISRETAEVSPGNSAAVPLTVSVGMTLVGPDEPPQSFDALIEAADGALYAAKRTGKNRAVFAPAAAKHSHVRPKD